MIGHFYFAPFQNGMLITNDTGRHVFLSREDFHKFIHEDGSMNADLLNELEEKGFCYYDSKESYIRKVKGTIRDANGYLMNSTSLFIFAVTNACNNRCLYCQANGMGEANQMSEEVADMALLRIKDSPSKRITIEFQGGEPLLNFNTIQYIVRQGQKLLRNKEVQYTLVSNLGLLTEEMASFFRDYHVSVSTSIDGPAYLHDFNRPKANRYGSYKETISGINLLRSMNISPGAIQTTTLKSLSFANEIVDEYVKQGFRQIFLRPLTRLGAAARCWNQIGYDAEQFLLFYKTALKRIIEYNLQGIPLKEYHASLFLTKILCGQSMNYMELRSPCGAGLGQIAITSNGNVYTCDEGRMMAEMGDEAFCLGNVFENDYYEWIHSSSCQAICSASLLDTLPGCCDCVYKPYCGVCPVINYAINGNITHVYSERCKIHKGILNILFEYIIKNDEKIMAIFEEWGRQS